MLQNKFEMPLDLAVKSSKIFNFYICFIFFLSFISIFISALMLSVKLLLFFSLLGFAVFYFKRQAFNKITSLSLSGDNAWRIKTNNLQSYDVELHGECIVTYFFVWLNFSNCESEDKSQTFHILLLPDSADKDLLRKLRVRLRFLKNQTADDIDEVRENSYLK